MKTLANKIVLSVLALAVPQMSVAASVDALPFQTPIECVFQTGEKFALEIVDLEGYAGEVNELRIKLLDIESKPLTVTLSAVSSPAMRLPSPYDDKHFESQSGNHTMTITYKNEISGRISQKKFTCSY